MPPKDSGIDAGSFQSGDLTPVDTSEQQNAGIDASSFSEGDLMPINSIADIPKPEPKLTDVPPDKFNAGDVLGGLLGGVPSLENAIPGMASFATGFAKSVPSTLQGMADIGRNIVQAITQKPQPEAKIPSQFTQATNPMEEVGKTAGDVAQYFLPIGAEKAVNKGIDGLLDVGKLTEHFGPDAAKVIQNIVKVIGAGVSSGLSTGAVSAAQSGGNLQETESGGLAGLVGGALGKTLEIVAPGITKSLIKSGFKLTPQQNVNLAPKIEKAATFMQENAITGTDATKFKKLSSLTNTLEDTLKSTANEEITIPRKDIEKQLTNVLSLPEIKSDKAVYKSVVSDVNEALATLKDTEGKNVTLENVLAGKRSYGKAAFGKATARIKGAVVNSEGAYAVEQAYQSALDKGIQDSTGAISLPKELQSYFGGKTSVSISDFNKVYSSAIDAKKLSNAAQFKKDSGLVGRLFGLWVGESVGQAVLPGIGGKIIGGTVGEVASTKIPSIVRNAAEIGINKGSSLPIATKIGLGINGAQQTP